MYLKSIELSGFKSFGRKTTLEFTSNIAAIVGPNGSGKSNVAEAFRFVLGEQSMKSLRSKKGEDLIWGGSTQMPRQNRASAKVTFDNSKRLLDIDFPEVVVERVVYRDGLNEYLLNGTQVRLKDIIRLLAGANIGGSGYQIISQGEADRILSASPRERREMVEDALGLKLYQHKKAESERKLEETANNMEKTASLRREIAPHLNFLRQQVEKIEKVRDMREMLSASLHEYLERENAWITQEEARLKDELRELESDLKKKKDELGPMQRTRSLSGSEETSSFEESLRKLEDMIRGVRRERDLLSRELGRAEGARAAKIPAADAVPAVDVREFAQEIETQLASIEEADDVGTIRTLLASLRSRVQAFAARYAVSKAESAVDTDAVAHIATKAAGLEAEEKRLVVEVETVRTKIMGAREAVLIAQRDSVALEGEVRGLEGTMNSIHSQLSAVAQLRVRFEEEVREGIALLGLLMPRWSDTIPEGALSEDRSVQEKRRREIERLKIKIEDAGTGNGEAIVQEFKQTKDREEYLARELADLQASAKSLKDIIADLDKTIDARFTEGLVKINVALHNFFTKLFGGGEAKLSIEKPEKRSKEEYEEGDEQAEELITEEEEIYPGLGISVSLPRKKIRGLESLSGGERALTSIALIFSMTQVNPPPFLILDETDAALDEANSRRYADMIEELGAHSQLIVITHNRATMAAAGELYGVSMSSDGVSKLLSVKFEEAQRVAK